MCRQGKLPHILTGGELVDWESSIGMLLDFYLFTLQRGLGWLNPDCVYGDWYLDPTSYS